MPASPSPPSATDAVAADELVPRPRPAGLGAPPVGLHAVAPPRSGAGPRRGRALERLPDHRPSHRAPDRRYGDRHPYLIALAVARLPRRLVTGLVRLPLHPPLPGRSHGARRAVRPAQRHARAPPGARLRQPRPHADRPAGGPGQLRLDAGAGAAQLLLHHERQRAPHAVLAGGHVLPVARCSRWSA